MDSSRKRSIDFRDDDLHQFNHSTKLLPCSNIKQDSNPQEQNPTGTESNSDTKAAEDRLVRKTSKGRSIRVTKALLILGFSNWSSLETGSIK